MGQAIGLTALTMLALLVANSAHALPTEEIPTSEPEYLAKVTTGAPEQIVANSTITMKLKEKFLR